MEQAVADQWAASAGYCATCPRRYPELAMGSIGSIRDERIAVARPLAPGVRAVVLSRELTGLFAREDAGLHAGSGAR